METNKGIELVTVILSLGSVVVPVLFGYVLWRMSQVFVTKPEFIVFQKSLSDQKMAIDHRLESMEADLKELLQRTAFQRIQK